MKCAITGIKQLVTCSNQGLQPKRGLELKDVGIIENATVVVEDGRILFLGSASSLTKTLSDIPAEKIFMMFVEELWFRGLWIHILMFYSRVLVRPNLRCDVRVSHTWKY